MYRRAPLDSPILVLKRTWSILASAAIALATLVGFARSLAIVYQRPAGAPIAGFLTATGVEAGIALAAIAVHVVLLRAAIDRIARQHASTDPVLAMPAFPLD